jgi:hypothetical protein
VIRLILAAAGLVLPGSSEGQCPASVERMFLGAIATAPSDYEGQVVELCGTVAFPGDLDSRERALFDVSAHSGEGYAILVFDPGGELPAEGNRACVVGTARRRDGLTAAEARARGLPNRTVADAAVRYLDYVFYPLPCGTPQTQAQSGERG